MEPYSSEYNGQIPTLRPSVSKNHDFDELLKSLRTEMNSTHPTTQLKVGHEMIRSQHAAMTLLLGEDGIKHLKATLYNFLAPKHFSENDAHFLVYGTHRLAGPVAHVVEICKAGFHMVSDHIVEPPIRFVLKRVIYDTTKAVLVRIQTLQAKFVKLPPDRQAPPPPAQQAQAAATPQRLAPPRPAKPPGTADLVRRLSQQQPAAPVAAAAAPQALPIQEEPAAEQPAIPPSRCACVSRVANSIWNRVPEKGRTWITKTLVKEFIKDPIHDIAQKTTAGVVLYVSGALTYAVGGAIIASAGAVGSAIAGAATGFFQGTKST